MTMGVQEIVRDYRTAKSKKDQITVMAELNACSRMDILRVLQDAGVVIDRRGLLPAEKTELFGPDAAPSGKNGGGVSAADAGKTDRHAGDVGHRLARTDPGDEPDGGAEAGEIKSVTASAGSPGGRLTVGLLLEQLSSLPPELPILMGGGPVETITFVREFNARTGATISEVQLS